MKSSDPANDGYAGSPTPNSRHKRTGQRDPLVVQPPLIVPLGVEDEHAAIDALAELLATWWERQHGEPNAD